MYNNKAVKKTLTIPEWLNEAAASMGLNFSQVLQEALLRKCSKNKITIRNATHKKEAHKMDFLIMPVAGLEPARIAPHDFESCASANSATPATRIDLNMIPDSHICVNHFICSCVNR